MTHGSSAIQCFLVIVVLLPGCSLVPKERSWDFMTSVGGIAVETPRKTPEGLVLPVRADVSGLQAISNEPTTLNSILSCSATRARVTGQEILLTISTSLLREGGSSLCPAARLGTLTAGQYTVLYGTRRSDAKPIGVVEVAR